MPNNKGNLEEWWAKVGDNTKETTQEVEEPKDSDTEVSVEVDTEESEEPRDVSKLNIALSYASHLVYIINRAIHEGDEELLVDIKEFAATLAEYTEDL